MNATDLKINVATPQGWETAKDWLRAYAKDLGLVLSESGALPDNTRVPQIEMGHDTMWTCPHCNAENSEMVILEVESRTDSMKFEAPKDHFMGQWEPKGDATGESELISYMCPACEGFVYPEEEVAWC